MGPGYPRIYAPTVRNPQLFHHNTGPFSPIYHPGQPRIAHSTTNLYFPQPTSPSRPPLQSQLQFQSLYTVQAPLPYNPYSYPYYSAMPKSMVPSQVPFSAYSIPTVAYASIASSKGLSLILIATLILVALDLVIIRPQKSRSEVQSSMSEGCPLIVNL